MMAEQGHVPPQYCSPSDGLQSAPLAPLHPDVPRDLSLAQWLTHLEQQHPVSIDMGLSRVQRVAERLGLTGPHARRPGGRVITVAGTNGKGSTVAMLEALGRAHGLSTATYTSPHLLEYNERLTFDGHNASDAALITAFEQVDSARRAVIGAQSTGAQSAGAQPESRQADDVISLTYFEAGTLAGLWLIAQSQPDLAILEVGLGGRLDAVNIIDCDVAIITTVAQDHAAFLGTDLENIGFEKAGILRAERPAIFGSDCLPASCAAHARSLGVTPQVLWQDFHWQQASHSEDASSSLWEWLSPGLEGETPSLDALPDPGLPRDNAASALAALKAAGVVLEKDAVRKALASVKLKGRMQWLKHRGRDWCLDVGHNPHAAAYLAQRLLARDAAAGRDSQSSPRLALLAMLGDKDAGGVIEALAPVVDGFVVATLGGERSREASDLAAVVRHCGGQVLAECPTVTAAAEWLAQDTGAGEVLVCGSFFTVSEVLTWLEASA